MTLVQALERIGESKNWIILKRIHEEPEYRAALELFISELSELTGANLRRRYRDPILTIFITSPNRITPYHLDGEANFLAQVQGTKVRVSLQCARSAHPDSRGDGAVLDRTPAGAQMAR